MKELLKIAWFYLGYVFYVLITIKERNEYQIGLTRGYDCTGSHDDSRILYGSVTKYYFDRSLPPERRYITYQQYKELHYPIQKED